MRRFFLAALALLLIPALALAGKTVTSGNNTLKIKAAFDPAKASKSKDRLRPTETAFDYFAGTNDGSRLPEGSNIVVIWAVRGSSSTRSRSVRDRRGQPG